MNLADIISRHARETPSAAAVIAGDREIDYLRFDCAIWRAATEFRARGIAPGDVVGITMRSGAAYLVAAYALARIGAVQIPLPRSESASVRERLTRRFGIGTVIGDTDIEPDWLERDEGPIDEAARAPGGDAGWRIVMSSGTTAEPKAVLQSHAVHCAWSKVYASAIPGQSSDRLLAFVELDFSAGLRQCMEMHWAGSTVVFASTPIRSANDFVAAVERYEVNYLHMVATNLHRLLPALNGVGPRLPRVRVLRSGGMIVSQKLRREVQQRLTPNLIVTYGTNEGGWPMTYADRQVMEQHPGAIGISPPGVQIEVVDEKGAALPPGEPGLIRAKLPGLLPDGYIDNPKATAESFRDGWYYPGDVGMLSDSGALYFKGRADDLMNFEGIKLYPADIEAALLEHPAVADVASFPLRSAPHQDVPAAAVVLREPVSGDVLTAWCRERLGVRAPRVVAVVQTLPRNPAGKVLKREVALTVLQSLRRR